MRTTENGIRLPVIVKIPAMEDVHVDEIVPPGRNFPCNHAFGELFQKPGGLLRDVPGHKKLHVTGFQAGKVLFKVVESDHNPLRVRMISQIFIYEPDS